MAQRSQIPLRSVGGGRMTIRRRSWRTILEFHGAITAVLDKELRAASGLELQTYDALLHVYEAGEAGIRMTDLAQRVILSKSGLTNVVDRLEQRGFARRLPDETDRRATRIILTAKGERTFLEAARVHQAGIKKHFADRLSDDEAKVILETLGRIRDEVAARPE